MKIVTYWRKQLDDFDVWICMKWNSFSEPMRENVLVMRHDLIIRLQKAQIKEFNYDRTR